MEARHMLSDRDAAILDFEARPFRYAGRKEEAVRSTFGLTFARYYQLLNVLIDTEDALQADPVLVHRLQDARARRVRVRARRELAPVL